MKDRNNTLAQKAADRNAERGVSIVEMLIVITMIGVVRGAAGDASQQFGS
jgi:prepilin-type N-terminal cleavage/methylation domain-containing protein